MEKIIVVDVDKCMACHSCELACAVAHSRSDTLDDAAQETPRPYSRIILERLDDQTLPLHCRHCEDAPCIRVCPTQAIFRASDLSPVVIDNQKCIGCNECILVCPFGVIRKDKDGKYIVKCDLCSQRLEAGRVPACVEACPTRAIKYRTPDKVAGQKREKYKVLIKKGEA